MIFDMNIHMHLWWILLIFLSCARVCIQWCAIYTTQWWCHAHERNEMKWKVNVTITSISNGFVIDFKWLYRDFKHIASTVHIWILFTYLFFFIYLMHTELFYIFSKALSYYLCFSSLYLFTTPIDGTILRIQYFKPFLCAFLYLLHVNNVT